MNIDEQVALLMSGTNFGDKQLRDKMGIELEERLLEAEKEKRPRESTADLIQGQATFTWVILCPCEN